MNAVFERDYVRGSVSTRYLWMRAGFAVAIGLFVGLRAIGASVSGNYEDVGGTVLQFSVWSGFALLAFAAPGAFGTSLVHARAEDTLAILLASPITPFQLSWGAFAARAAGLGVFVFACWPPVAVALAYGGVRGPQLFVATAALLGTLLLIAAPAFVISAWSRSTAGAVVSAYIAAAATVVGLAAAVQPLLPANPLLAHALSPIHGIRAAVDPRVFALPGGDGGALLLPLGALAATGAVLLATWRLDAEARGTLEARATARNARPYRPLVHENPILDRELRTAGALEGRAGSRGLTMVLLLAEVAYLAAASQLEAFSSIALFGGFLAFETTLLVLTAAAAGATAFAAEKETNTLDVLRVTPLTPLLIVRGKLAGLLRGIVPGLVIPCVHLAIGAVSGIVSVAALPAYLIAGAVVSSTWAVIGMSQSLDQRDPQRAVRRTMGVLAIFGVLMAGYAGWALRFLVGGTERWIEATVPWGANPIGAILAAVAPFRVGGSTAETTLLVPPTASQSVFGAVACVLWLALHVLAGLFVARRLAHLYRTRFDG